MAHERLVEALRSVAGEVPVLLGRAVWANLPLLLAIDLLVVLASLPALVTFAAGWAVFVPLVAGVLLGPVWAAAMSVAGAMVREDDVSFRQVGVALQRHGLVGLRIGLVVGAVAAVSVGTLTLWDANPDRVWLLVPLVVDGSVLALVAVASLSAFTLAEGGLRGWDLWLGSLQLAARRPFLTAGTIAVAVLAAFAVSWLPLVALVLPGPFAVYLAACAYSPATSSTSRPSVSSR
jgi:hypothetical protein